MNIFKKLSVATAGTAFIALVTTVAAPSRATTLTGFETFGDEMVGMEVTVNFLGGGSQTATWGVTASDAGGAVGTNWSLTESGDTFFSPWTFSNSGQSITSLRINAVPGNTVFDRVLGDEITPGSADGAPFTVISGAAPDTFAYSVPIDISQGDLFGVLSLNYNSGFTGTMTYRADTDSGTADDPVTPDPTPDDPTPIPFEFSPSLGILMLGAWGAIAQLKSIVQKRKTSGSAFSKN